MCEFLVFTYVAEEFQRRGGEATLGSEQEQLGGRTKTIQHTGKQGFGSSEPSNAVSLAQTRGPRTRRTGGKKGFCG